MHKETQKPTRVKDKPFQVRQKSWLRQVSEMLKKEGLGLSCQLTQKAES